MDKAAQGATENIPYPDHDPSMHASLENATTLNGKQSCSDEWKSIVGLLLIIENTQRLEFE